MVEAAFHPDWFSSPGQTLGAILARRNISATALAAHLDCSREVVRDLLAGTLPIDDRLAAQLPGAVGGSEAFWRKRQAAYDESLALVANAIPDGAAKDWLRQLPISTMKSSGWLRPQSGKLGKLKACLAYFNVTGPEEWRRRYEAVSADSAFRTSAAFESGLGSLSTWLRQAEIEASLAKCSRWDSLLLSQLLPTLRKLTLLRRPAAFLPVLRNHCAEAGVALVVLRAPAGCRASGAARFISADRAMIVLSFRHLVEDHLWFTFFHEVAHLLLHGRSATFVDLEPATTDVKEREANEFAATLLVPIDRQEELRSLGAYKRPIIRFASRLGVSPGIIVGQLQHQKIIGPEQLNFLKRRYTWAEVSEAL